MVTRRTPRPRWATLSRLQRARRHGIGVVALLLTLALLTPSSRSGVRPAAAQSTLSANATVFATGLYNPRGLTFGPDGALYVAEGGAGGTTSTVGQCDQVPAPLGPYTGSATSARISRIAADGTRTTVVDGLPSSATTPQTGSFTTGVSGVAFLGDTLYGIEGGAGCSHGVPTVPNMVFRVNGDGSWTQVADLSAFVQANPVQSPDPDDFEPDGTWYGLVALNGTLYATEPNHQEIDAITPDGGVTRVADLSTYYPGPTNWNGPTGLAVRDGNLYTGYLTPFPTIAHASHVSQITPDGKVTTVAAGFTAVMAVAFDAHGRLYVLENGAPGTDPQGPPVQPGTGRVVRVTDGGGYDVVATGLTLPTAMTFGPDGLLYVSDVGYGPGANMGAGQIVRIDVTAPAAGS